ncbi:hypothetical protein H0H87_008438 [Tephrocybe sp. NHM501043]|nr:hypothetical protein H0H87_008438 [Tephrocybe sp. NHM501043]
MPIVGTSQNTRFCSVPPFYIVSTLASNQCKSTASKVHPSFNSKVANVVLRSSEGTLYSIPSFVLRNTTSYFRSILHIPPAFGQQTSSQEQLTDSIVVDEKDVILGRILRLISGLETPTWGTFEEVEEVMSLAEKWNAPGPISVMRSTVTAPKFLVEPLCLYGMAAQFRWEEETKLASTHTLKLSIYDEEYADLLQ